MRAWRREDRYLNIVIVMLITALVVLLICYRGQEQSRAREIANQIEAAQQQERGAELWQIGERKTFYQKLRAGEAVSVLIVGDSIAEPTDEAAWMTRLRLAINEDYGAAVRVVNVSMGGNSSYAGYVRTMLQPEESFDLAIICYGQNDAPADFSRYYESIIRGIGQKYPGCAVIAVLESSQREYTEKMQVIQQLAAHYGIPVADTIAAFDASGYPYEALSDDGIHPNSLGKELYFKSVYALVAAGVASDWAVAEVLPAALNDGMEVFESWKWIDATDFTRVDDITLTIQTVPMQGILGIDYSYHSGSNQVEIWLDGQMIAAPEVYFNYDFSQRHILVVSEKCQVSQEIRLVFGSADQADAFRGLMWSGNVSQ